MVSCVILFGVVGFLNFLEIEKLRELLIKILLFKVEGNWYCWEIRSLGGMKEY